MPGDENAKRTEAYAREHLANERTHLAYVRTAIALLSFGITLNRFSLYFLEAEPGAAQVGSRSLLREVVGLGAGMVLLGMAMIAWAAVRYLRAYSDIERGAYRPDRTAILVFTAALFVIGAASIVWLFAS
ncbi:YidH family protein [Sorangium sp. So ce233]|uniref:YidH family protein n=1 Tax=Sorangium sp. So ce233 TaxID=3133290 RepID=UPI003F63EA6E